MIDHGILSVIDVDPQEIGVSSGRGAEGFRGEQPEFRADPLDFGCGKSASKRNEIASVNTVAEFAYGGWPDDWQAQIDRTVFQFGIGGGLDRGVGNIEAVGFFGDRQKRIRSPDDNDARSLPGYLQMKYGLHGRREGIGAEFLQE